MELYQFADAYDPMTQLCSFDFPLAQALCIYQLKREIDPWAKFYAQEELKLMQRYAKTGEDGKLLVEDGKIHFESRAQMDEYLQRVQQLRQMPVTFSAEMPTLQPDDQQRCRLTPAQIGQLAPFIKFGGD
ncbi:MAG: hypothetical protein HFG20_05725 [Anaerotruncus sp.]|nr:hypothetical protein [Anaerotruncus sp.]